MRWMVSGLVALVVVLAGNAGVWGQVVITEIMYNPASPERVPVRTEWVEVYNAGERAVDLAGWRLADEDGSTGVLSADSVVEPGEAVVLIPDGCGVEAFREAWGEEVRAFALTNWTGRAGALGLANNPSEDNEILSLRNSEGDVVDEVNYQVDSPWPGRAQGPSIYLLPTLVNDQANDEGSRWRLSEVGQHGAWSATATDLFVSEDVGSPGVMVVEEDEGE